MFLRLTEILEVDILSEREQLDWVYTNAAKGLAGLNHSLSFGGQGSGLPQREAWHPFLWSEIGALRWLVK